MLVWKRSSDYSIVSEDGRFHIAKFVSNGVPGFLLWDRNELIPGCTDNAQARKEQAQRILRGGR